MAKKHDIPSAGDPAHSRRLAPAAKKGRGIVGTLARSTLFAAGFAVSQLGIPEMDSRFHLFSPTLVDRLHAPITRYHE